MGFSDFSNDALIFNLLLVISVLSILSVVRHLANKEAQRNERIMSGRKH